MSIFFVALFSISTFLIPSFCCTLYRLSFALFSLFARVQLRLLENSPNMNMFHVGSPSYEDRLGLFPRSFFHFEKERETEIAGGGGRVGKNLQHFPQQTRADRGER